jgi:hypothetical protein
LLSAVPLTLKPLVINSRDSSSFRDLITSSVGNPVRSITAVSRTLILVLFSAISPISDKIILNCSLSAIQTMTRKGIKVLSVTKTRELDRTYHGKVNMVCLSNTIGGQAIMALRQLPALTKKQWDFVTDKLSKEPTKEQRKRAMKIVKKGNKIKTIPS